MRIVKNIIMLAAVIGGFASCELEDPIESTITEYAEFEMSGEEIIYIQQGTSYEEPGVTAKAGEDQLEVEISGEVDTETPGVYILDYSATNADGFPATVTRYVVVGNKEVAVNRDLSGEYSPANSVTKIQDGIYQLSDMLPPNGISVWMADLGNGSLVVPPQSSRFGEVYVDSSINPDSEGILHEDMSFTLKEYIACCGIYTRTFTKQ